MKEIVQTSLDWLDDLEQKVRAIENEWKIDTFKRYRQAGQIILKFGYEEEKYGTKDSMRQAICNRMQYKDDTFYIMLKLAKMDEEDFLMTIIKFTSLYSWKHQSKPKQIVEAKLIKFPVPESSFESEEAAEAFFRKYHGNLLGKKMYYEGTIADVLQADAKRELP